MINVIRPGVTSETQSDLEMIPVTTAACGFYSSYSMEVASFSHPVNTTHLQGTSTTSMPSMGWLTMDVAFMLAMGWFAMDAAFMLALGWLSMDIVSMLAMGWFAVDAASILGMGWLSMNVTFMLTMEWFAVDGLQCPLPEDPCLVVIWRE